jgi:hypothetical protein
MKNPKELLKIGQTANLTAEEFVRLISAAFVIRVSHQPNDNENGDVFNVEIKSGYFTRIVQIYTEFY